MTTSTNIPDIVKYISKRLAEPLPGVPVQFQMAPSFRPAHSNTDDYTQAGVLLLLYERQNGLSLIFIKRPEYEGVHGGQISFPGGKYEPADGSIIHTALRETREEIGISENDIQVLGKLTSLYIPVSKMEVSPIVGYISQHHEFKIDIHEVAYIIETYLTGLLSPETKEVKPYQGKQYTGEIPYFNVDGNHIWGATAMILNEFLEIIRPLYEPV